MLPGSGGPTILVIPGGLGWQALVGEADVMDWLGRVAQLADGLVAISTGSLLLAATGLLDGDPATGHWLAQDDLAAMGADARAMRSVSSHDGRWITVSGTQAGVTAASELAERIVWGR